MLMDTSLLGGTSCSSLQMAIMRLSWNWQGHEIIRQLEGATISQIGHCAPHHSTDHVLHEDTGCGGERPANLDLPRLNQDCGIIQNAGGQGKEERKIFDPTLPTTVYLEVPNGKKLAVALQSKGISYVICWQDAFSRYAACHFQHALLSVIQSAPLPPLQAGIFSCGVVTM
ncbi:hypothetical protein M0R45_032247 [Rubus argutus]|uniref:Uncharacterized protein n=1 Tax=Rubus argutus TaxID=59490 RepID=A0AAW1WJX4_RUBAR